jgi:signal transduction histidine kinase
MLTEILFLLLVLAVAALMVADLARTRSETSHGQADRPAYAAERVTAVPSRGPAAGAFSTEPAGIVTAAPDAGRSRPPESIASRPGSVPRPDTVPAYRDGSRSRASSPKVRSPVVLLVTIPAATAAVVTLCIVRIATLLTGPSIHSQISSVHDGAVTSVIAASVVLVIVLVLGAWATFKAAGSVLRPRQRLEAGVLGPAGLRLPGGGRSAVGAIDVDSSNEIADADDVFHRMRREISQLTANEAALRGRLNGLLVNLSHRGRSLAEHQIRLVENLKRRNQDERHLASLNQMNRIAMHLYRNSQNLLLLAGREPPAGSNQALTLTYLVQTAASEIEEGDRVSSQVQPDITVRGPAARDLVHLLAELIQNATSFSAADMPVHVTGRTLTTGGVLIDITDRGIGMTDREMAYANWQLENPSATDIDFSKRMGLLIVARLAGRQRIRVRLNQAGSGGLTALVWLPDEVLTHQGVATPPIQSDVASALSEPGLPKPAEDPGYATAARTTASVTSAGFASAQGNPQDASAGTRPATGSGQRPRPAQSSGGPQRASRPESSVVRRGERPLTTQTQALGDQAAHGEVILPPPQDLARTGGPTIYNEMESHWFRGGRQVPSSSGHAATAESHWSSPADEGWKAAQTIDSPSSGGSTAAGLPRRLPNANLVPGSIPDNPPAASIPDSPPAAPDRSPAAVRDRLGGLQRGVTEGRAAASEASDPGGNDES